MSGKSRPRSRPQKMMARGGGPIPSTFKTSSPTYRPKRIRWRNGRISHSSAWILVNVTLDRPGGMREQDPGFSCMHHNPETDFRNKQFVGGSVNLDGWADLNHPKPSRLGLAALETSRCSLSPESIINLHSIYIYIHQRRRTARKE